MKFVTIALMALVLLSGCETAHFNAMALPDVVNYPQPTMNKAAAEIGGGSCPVLGEVMMPDYGVMRDQTRAAKAELAKGV